MKHGNLLRIANVVMFFAFVAFTLVQYNDPDSLVWMITYGLAALCCLLFFLGRLSPTLGALLAIGALLWALVLAYFVFTDGVAFTMSDAAGERTREMFGLLILAAWVAFISRRAAVAKKASRN